MPRKSKNAARVSDVVAAIDRIAPFRLAESWDNVGLQFGDPDAEAGKILVALEVTKGILAEARKARVNTLVTHHPLLFRPPNSLAEVAPVPQLAAEVIRMGLAHVAAHTNFDAVAYGTNGVLADLLDLQAAGRRFLQPAAPESENCKYAVFVPVTHVEAVIEAIARAGAGVIGDYSHCTFRTPGTGTYKPLAGANPYAGKVGKLEQAEEVRLECVCPRGRLPELMASIRSVHPYEEVAYDVFPLLPDPRPTAGIGLVGELKRPSTVQSLVARMKKELGVKSIGVVGKPGAKVRTVAICSGAGGEMIRRWRPGTADLFVTGEMTHHDCAEAHHRGVACLLVGHWASEAIAMPRLADLLRMALAKAGFPNVPIKATTEKSGPVSRF